MSYPRDEARTNPHNDGYGDCGFTVRSYPSSVRRALSFLVLSTCSPTPDFALSFNILADVRGQANAACVLTITNGPNSAIYDVEPPPSMVIEQPPPSSRPDLGSCVESGAGFSTEETVIAAARGGGPPVVASRNQCLNVVASSTLTQRDLFAFLGITSQQCPTTASLTLVCGNATMYEDAPLDVCVTAQ